MGQKYLIDSNAVIEFLGNTLPGSGSNWLQNIIDQNEHAISVINQMELLGFKGQEDEMQTLQDFVSVSQVFSLSDVVVQKTIELRITHSIKLPDAIIAATALIHNLSLVTRNISDFSKIAGLNCINPHEQ